MAKSNVLRCRYCGWNTPKWKGHRVRDVDRAWFRLTKHVKAFHHQEWIAMAVLLGEEDRIEDNPFKEEEDE